MRKISSEKNEFRKKVESTQEWEEKEFNFDPDSSPEAWKHYKKYYKKVGSFGEPVISHQKYSRMKSNVSVGDITYEIVGNSICFTKNRFIT